MTTFADTLTEAEFGERVLQLASVYGWLIHHDRPARNRRGKWATHIQGHPGFPDLVLVRPTNGRGRVIFAELKSEKGRLTEDQQSWLRALGHTPGGQHRQATDPGANPEVYVWRPSDMPEIEETLK